MQQVAKVRQSIVPLVSAGRKCSVQPRWDPDYLHVGIIQPHVKNLWAKHTI